uniref:Protein nervous wreck-like n=1 Tax=Diabrotica virgifera virgifera TaxID=50390 RepID=A0A6P7H4W5_DIAVI
MTTMESGVYDKVAEYLSLMGRTELLTCSAMQNSFSTIRDQAKQLTREYNLQCCYLYYPVLKQHIHYEFDPCDNDPVEHVTADHDSSSATLSKEARRWATKIARENNNVKESVRKLQIYHALKESGQRVDPNDQNGPDLETKIEEMKQAIRRAETAKTKAEARIECLRGGGVNVDEWMQEAESLNVQDIQRSTSSLSESKLSLRLNATIRDQAKQLTREYNLQCCYLYYPVLKQHIHYEFDPCDNDPVEHVTADHDSSSATLSKEARRWATKIARENNNVKESVRKLQIYHALKESGQRVDPNDQNGPDLETKIEEMKHAIRRAETAKTKAEARIECLRGGGVNVDEWMQEAESLNVQDIQRSTSSLSLDSSHHQKLIENLRTTNEAGPSSSQMLQVNNTPNHALVEKNGLKKKKGSFFQSITSLQKNSAKVSSKRDQLEEKSTGARNDYLLCLAAANAHQT